MRRAKCSAVFASRSSPVMTELSKTRKATGPPAARGRRRVCRVKRDKIDSSVHNGSYNHHDVSAFFFIIHLRGTSTSRILDWKKYDWTRFFSNVTAILFQLIIARRTCQRCTYVVVLSYKICMTIHSIGLQTISQ